MYYCNTQQNLLFCHLCNVYKITVFTISYKIIIYCATKDIKLYAVFIKMFS